MSSTSDATVPAKSTSTTSSHSELRPLRIDFISVDDVYETIKQEMASPSPDDVVLTVQSLSRMPLSQSCWLA